MALFKKEKPEPKPEAPVSRNTREVEELTAMFAVEPQEAEPQPVEDTLVPPQPILKTINGTYKRVNINEITMPKTAVQTDELVVREVNGKYEIIGVAPIEVKVVQANNEETTIMMLDYIDKTKGLPEKNKLNLYKYELQKSDVVEKLSGKTPAALNGFGEAEFANMVLKGNIDANLKVLPPDALLEASKLSADMQKVLGNIVKKVGTKNITAAAIKSLAGVQANETAVLMKLLQA